ncbi:MAG: hypothetical protein WC596_00505 [Candidatus Shapirobacteria bacterium]
MNKEIVNKIFGLVLPLTITLTGCRTPNRYATQGPIFTPPRVEGRFQIVTKHSEDLPKNRYSLSLINIETGEILYSDLVDDLNNDGACLATNLIVRPRQNNNKISLDLIPILSRCDDRFVDPQPLDSALAL